MGMNTVNQQRKAIHKHTVAEAVRQKDKGSISWEKGDGKCYICDAKFGKFFGREHHCRSCGKVVCNGHSKNQQKIYRWALYKTQGAPNPFRECDKCLNKENEAIQKVSAENENLAIAALIMLTLIYKQSAIQPTEFTTPRLSMFVAVSALMLCSMQPIV